MTGLGGSAKRRAMGTARRRRARLGTVLAGLAVALGVLGAPGVAAAAAPNVTITDDAPSTIVPGTQITFSATASDPDDVLLLFPRPLSYSWSCGDTPTQSSTTCTVANSKGLASVNVTVTDSDGEQTTAVHQFVIANVAPSVEVSGPTSAHLGTAFTVNASAADANGDGLTYAWSLDGAPMGVNAPSVSLSLSTKGTHTVSVRVSDGTASDSDSMQITGTNATPTASLKVTNTPPIALGATGATVELDASASADADGDPLTFTWDFGDGSPEQVTTTPTITHAYTTADDFVASVTVSDGLGGSATKSAHVEVVPSLLTASFTFSPVAPGIGQAVSLASTSVGPDSPIVSWTWDLDNDGQFDDASGPTAQWSFAAAASHQVSLKVTNAAGVSSTAFQTINVTGPATAPPPASSTPGASPPAPASSARRIRPFPVVRIRGFILRGAVRVTLLSVKTRRGSRVRVRCSGRGCPFRVQATTARSSRRSVRFRKLERRLRAGTIIRVYVTRGRSIGKYTRFRIRSGAAPARVDRCLPPGSLKPTRCPAS